MKRDRRILAFHGLKQKGKISVRASDVSYSNIVRALNEFSMRGYCFKTASEIVDDFESKSVYIYFDDCDESLIALFESKEIPQNFKATLFVIANHINSSGSWDVIDKNRKSLDKNYIESLIKRGFEIGSHTRTHNPITIVGNSLFKSEIASSKAELEELFNTPVNFFSPPFGEISSGAVDAILKAGYKGIFSVANNKNLCHDKLFIANPVTAFDSWETIVSKRVDDGINRFLNNVNSCLYNNFSKGSVLLKKFQLS